MSILNKVNYPKDLKKLTLKEKEELAKEIREYILKIVSNNGGHLASNLGAVELTIAIHSVFNTPKDKIVWDVGHQTYVHKILTGRKDKMPTLRTLDGISGFPKRSESEYDIFNVGHSSTSISAAIGMARARDIKKEKNEVIAIIGDGALTGGMALEALNDAGSAKTNIIIILNDNEMSISKNVGGISNFLAKVRSRKFYKKSNNLIKRITLKIPFIGEKLVKLVQDAKYSIKKLFISNMLFEDMGYTYLGPVDGHNIEKLENILNIAKKIDGPKLIHVVTKKGKGYKIAEENPDKYHATGPMDLKTGKTKAEKKTDYSKIFGDKLVDLAKNNKNIVAITASMKDGTGLTKFAKEYPDRFFDVGIAEGHAVCMAGGMATDGLIPVVPIYSSFYQRAYDQVIHDICMQNLHVVLCADRAGIVGADGETHQGILDLSFFNIIPNLAIMAPKDFKELEDMLEFAIKYNGPIYIRYPRGGEGKTKFKANPKIEFGRAELIKTGKEFYVIAIGKMVERAYEVANMLQKENFDVGVINARFLKPFDEENIKKWIGDAKIITLEDNILEGGLGTTVIEMLNKNKMKNQIEVMGYPDQFVKQGAVYEIEKRYGLDTDNIVRIIKNWSIR